MATSGNPALGQRSSSKKDARRVARLAATTALSLVLLAGGAIGYGRSTTAAFSASGIPITGETPCPLGGTAPCGDYTPYAPPIIPGETPCLLGGTAPCGDFLSRP